MLAQLLLPDLFALVAFRLHMSGVVLISFVPCGFLLRGKLLADLVATDIAHGVQNSGEVFLSQRIKGMFDSFVDIASIHGTFDQSCSFSTFARKKTGFAIDF